MSANGRIRLNDEILEDVNGGNIVFNPQGDGKYYMEGRFTGQRFDNVALGDIMRVIKYASGIPNTPEGEQQIIDWAREQGIIS